MGLATSTVKHVLLLLNFIFAVLGLILIGLGIFILVSAAQNTFDHGENWAAGWIIALGVISVCISIFGYLATMHESRKKLTIYIIILIVLILVQLLMTGMASQGTRDGLSGSVQDGFEKLWKYEMSEPGALAYYENWLHCCGVNGTADYRSVGHEIPKTCCKVHICTREYVYQEGCQAKFEEYLATKILIFGIVVWLLIISEIIGAVFAWMLLSTLKNRSRRANVGWM